MFDTRLVKTLLFSVTFILVLVLGAQPALATGCNAGGCWSAAVELVKVAPDGKIWFVVNNSAALNSLVPADGCSVRSIWTGTAEPSLYIRVDDPEREQKYALLLTALTTGQAVGFGPVIDPSNNWCSVDSLSIGQS
ncbi:MAG: hypothetical protein AAGD38_22040 [Acidobacteriota bacterium]